MPVDPLENFINNRRSDFDQEPPRGLWEKIDIEMTPEQDELDEFVNGNRAEFDTDEPPPGLWNKILADLPVQAAPAKIVAMNSRRNLSVYFRAAAAAVVILVAGALFLGRQMGYQAAQEQQMALIYAIDPDFLEAEDYYKNEIDQSYHKVSLHNDDPQLYADLEAIDESMEELKAQLFDVPREEQADIVADLIQSYQIKLQILQKVLQYLPNENSPTEDEHTDDEHQSTKI